MPKKIKAWLSILMSVFILTFFLYTQFSKAQVNNLQIYFFDVGQGDSILIRTPDGRDILIDGGPDSTVIERLGSVLPFWDRYIDMAILTHPHDDHINGLSDALGYYEFGKIVEPDLKIDPENLQYFNAKTEREVVTKSGENFNLGEGLSMKIIYPFDINLEEENINDTSIVFQLEYKGKKFLFTGDATAEVEAKILEQNLDSDFLKVGHHGSRYSSSAEFLAKVTPTISIISVGEGNSFGHPTQDTLDRLSAVGSRVLRTDRSGTIEVNVENSGEWTIKCSKECN